MMLGRPAYSRSNWFSSPTNAGSAHASRNAASNSWHAGTSVSGTKRPPNSPKRPCGVGSVMIDSGMIDSGVIDSGVTESGVIDIRLLSGYSSSAQS
jgi:hypothetical protein